MGTTYWYAYDRSGSPSGPYFETRAAAADACDDGETPRPVSGAVIDIDDSGEQDDADADPETTDGAKPLDEMGHDELKAEAERRGIADDIDLRSKAAIREGLRDA